jgi:UDP-2-acetamido-3-amino-2,3-dideoxy-glucuronate N-acetyltransferase
VADSTKRVVVDFDVRVDEDDHVAFRASGTEVARCRGAEPPRAVDDDHFVRWTVRPLDGRDNPAEGRAPVGCRDDDAQACHRPSVGGRSCAQDGDDAGKMTAPRRECGREPPAAPFPMPRSPDNDAPYRLIDDVEFGTGVTVGPFTNLYGCRIGDGTRIGPFVEIQRDVLIGARCKIQSHTFICTGVELDDEVFVGHGTMFINDKRPAATTEDGAIKSDSDWELAQTVVERRASIGSGAVILGGVRIGTGALVGAGAVVTADIAAGDVVAGVPARVLRQG